MWVARSVKVGAVQKPRQVHDWANQLSRFPPAGGESRGSRAPLERAVPVRARCSPDQKGSKPASCQFIGRPGNLWSRPKAAPERWERRLFRPLGSVCHSSNWPGRRHVLPWVCASRLFPADALLSTLQGSHCHTCRPARRTIGIPEAQKDAVIRRVKGHCSRPRHKHRERRGGAGSNGGRDTAGRR